MQTCFICGSIIVSKRIVIYLWIFDKVAAWKADVSVEGPFIASQSDVFIAQYKFLVVYWINIWTSTMRIFEENRTIPCDKSNKTVCKTSEQSKCTFQTAKLFYSVHKIVEGRSLRFDGNWHKSSIKSLDTVTYYILRLPDKFVDSSDVVSARILTCLKWSSRF